MRVSSCCHISLERNLHEVFRAIIVAITVRIASAMLPRPIKGEMAAIVETECRETCVKSKRKRGDPAGSYALFKFKFLAVLV